MAYFMNCEEEVRGARIFANARKNKIELVPEHRVCFCKNQQQAFFLAAVLNGQRIGDLWDGWGSIGLPWHTDGYGEFIYTRRDEVVTRITSTNLYREQQIVEKPAVTILKKIGELYPVVLKREGETK